MAQDDEYATSSYWEAIDVDDYHEFAMAGGYFMIDSSSDGPNISQYTS